MDCSSVEGDSTILKTNPTVSRLGPPYDEEQHLLRYLMRQRARVRVYLAEVMPKCSVCQLLLGGFNRVEGFWRPHNLSRFFGLWTRQGAFN